MSFDQLIKALILGIIQGLTEWLPISSTGHLKIAERALNLTLPALFEVVLHVGTLAVVVIFFRSDVQKIFAALKRLDFKSDYGRFVPLIIVGAVPTMAIGFVFHVFLEDFFSKVSVIAAAFIICGVALCSARVGKEKADGVGFSQAFLIGVAQGMAVVPGLSRSGLTITVALLLGIRREKAFKFSFLLSIPAIIGALALTLYEQFKILATSSFGFVETAVGTVVAVIFGYLALKLLWKTIAREKFHFFAFYCWALGTSLIVALCLGFL
ncbi:undecaprenyl-diphosphate phosphatase [Candidatus Bathyarchaeota archaeon]|nr:undecaprenyl-diphosphate phosphatase [Candidatus Bathyarchaeota archaeon]